MKKIVFALALVIATGSLSTAVNAATNGVKVVKFDDKKDDTKKTKKRNKKSAEKKGCSKEEGKGCCSAKKAS